MNYYEEEPYRDIEVVDRVGSGDAYISGALYGLLSSGGDCAKAVSYGNATSAVKNTIPGDLAIIKLGGNRDHYQGSSFNGPSA